MTSKQKVWAVAAAVVAVMALNSYANSLSGPPEPSVETPKERHERLQFEHRQKENAQFAAEAVKCINSGDC